MIVDDEPDNIVTVKTTLEADDYKVVMAENADDCLKKLKKEKPDLILMDIMMPGTPVKNVIKKIKNIKIVYLSVVRKGEARKQGLLHQKNIMDYIQKPYDINDLLKRVKNIINEK